MRSSSHLWTCIATPAGTFRCKYSRKTFAVDSVNFSSCTTLRCVRISY
uniref:Uncharacterized protein n=1 Tax=Ciona intestinalis TaxID=7719 RepID=H2XZ98_CIOIN